jgi:ribose transport system permease protein
VLAMNKTGAENIFKKQMVPFLLLLLFVYFSLTTRNFFSLNNATNLLRQTAVIGIMSTGFALVMIAGGLDLSVGSIISVVGCITALCIVHGVPIWLSYVIGMLISMAISLLNATMILVTGMPAMICTLAMQQVLQGITYMITGAAPVYGMPDSVKVLGQGYLWIIPVPVIIMVFCFAIGGFIMKRTYVGRYFYAVGSNPEATRLSGLSVKKIQLLSYLINGFFCGIAGIVMMSRIFSGQPKAGVGFEMDVITACVIGGVAFSGGKGTISGLVEGVLIMGVLSNGLGVKGVDSYTQLVFKGVVLILVVGIDCYQQLRAKNRKMKISSTEQLPQEAKESGKVVEK